MVCIYDGPFGKVFIYVFKSLEKRYIKYFLQINYKFSTLYFKKIVMNTFYFHNKK